HPGDVVHFRLTSAFGLGWRGRLIDADRLIKSDVKDQWTHAEGIALMELLFALERLSVQVRAVGAGEVAQIDAASVGHQCARGIAAHGAGGAGLPAGLAADDKGKMIDGDDPTLPFAGGLDDQAKFCGGHQSPDRSKEDYLASERAASCGSRAWEEEGKQNP